MSFILAGCALLLALLVGILILDDAGVGGRQKAGRDASSPGAWWSWW
jgi:hypothetical protein